MQSNSWLTHQQKTPKMTTLLTFLSLSLKLLLTRTLDFLEQFLPSKLLGNTKWGKYSGCPEALESWTGTGRFGLWRLNQTCPVYIHYVHYTYNHTKITIIWNSGQKGEGANRRNIMEEYNISIQIFLVGKMNSVYSLIHLDVFLFVLVL